MKAQILFIVMMLFLATKASSGAGDLDQSFGIRGITYTDFFGRTDVLSKLVIDEDGKIIMSGSATKNYSNDHFAISRYGVDGVLDESFGRHGLVATRNIAPNKTIEEGIFACGLQKNKTLVVAGRGVFDGLGGLLLLRYTDNGSLDLSFGDNGSAFVPDAEKNFTPLELTIDDNDQIIVVASAFGTEHEASFAVFRFNAEGSLDKSFGQGGKVLTKIAPGIDVPRAVKIDKEGRIVVAGFSGANQFVVLRYTSLGVLDTSFAHEGIATIHFHENGIDTLHALAIQEDGKIVVGGDVQVGSFAGLRMVDFGLARLLPNGELDMSFNNEGTQITYFVEKAASTLWALSLQSDGKIIAVGDASLVHGLGIARYNVDGSLDQSFGQEGKSIIPFERTSHWEAVSIQKDGKIVAGGYVWNGKQYDVAIARIEP
ncbi:MAG TPA: hypothetical protein VEK06_00630 [Myxococcota bacterium]|nr:hypothetical protein [Myxococcota bacterium]